MDGTDRQDSKSTMNPTELDEFPRRNSSSTSVANLEDEGSPPPSSADSAMDQLGQIEDSHSKRKRKRLTISCLTCRKRKIKCDRQKPCSSCVKNNVPAHLCVYDESPWVSSLIKDNKMTNELMNLKQENEHLTGLLKMNEQELNSLKNLLVDLKIGSSANSSPPHPSDLDAQQADVSRLLQEHFQNEEMKEKLLLEQPLNIGQFSCFKQTKYLVKVFGPSSWQNFVLDDLRTSYMLDSSIPYIFDLISKNERRIQQARIVKLRLFNESKIDEPKLKEIEQYLGNYDAVFQKVNLFCSVHRNAKFFKYVDDVKLLKDFDVIIKRDVPTNNCRIDIDLNSSESHVELANLASLLMILKISTIFQDTTFELDKDERLTSYAAHLFSSMMILEQPTTPAILALALFQTYQLYSPMDFGAEIIPHGTSRDWSMCLMIAINSALKLGFHTEVPSRYDPSHHNYLSPYHLREFWRAILTMDFVCSFQNGLPLAMIGYCDTYDNDKNSIIAKEVDSSGMTFEDVMIQNKTAILRSIAMKFSTTNQNHNKMSTKRDLVEDCDRLKRVVLESRKSEKLILEAFDPYNGPLIDDFMSKIDAVDVLLSITYTLFLSYSDKEHILNSNIDKSCFAKTNSKENFYLLKRYYNATLACVVYALRLTSWFFKRVFTDSYWSRNLVLQFMLIKQVKQVCLKSCSLLLIMLVRNTKVFPVNNNNSSAGNIVQFDSYFNQPKNIPLNIFKMPFDDLDKLIWNSDEKYELYNFEDESIMKNSVDLTMSLFKAASSQKSFLTIDRKWYISMELCYTAILFCFSNIRIINKKFDWREFNNQQNFGNFKRFYNVDDVNRFRKQNYAKNKNEIMKVTSLLN